MNVPAKFELPGSSRLRLFFRQPYILPVTLALTALMAVQASCYSLLGTASQTGRGISAFVVVFHSLIALACVSVALRRAQGITALFWFLFGAALAILLVPTAIYAYDTLFNQSTMSDATESLLYCLYGAPIMMMLFLPETGSRHHLKWETFLDLFQVTVVVSLVYSTFFFLPAQTMSPNQAFLRNLTVSNLLTLFLLAAALVRFRFARTSATRTLLLRLSLFLVICTVATLIGNWLEQHHYSSAFAWFDLGWDLPQIVAALVAITWHPSAESVPAAEPANFVNFLGSNVVLVAMLSVIHLLMDRWKEANGETLTDVAVAASLLAFTLRLAMTQFHQQQEISQREAAQTQLVIANDKVNGLLTASRRQTEEITQVSELGSLLQACSSQKEAFRLVPERMRRLFPGTSGCISLITPSKNRVESVAEWGPCPPADQLFTPDECWALRRGCAHAHSGGPSPLCCSHLIGDGASLCVPLIANGETIGTFALQDSVAVFDDAGSGTIGNDSAWGRQLATSVAENIAIAAANLRLRDALRLQAVRDPLTGLYNRRYMEEFLERELYRSVRKGRSVAVLMLDLDHFKRYNDTFGHAAGDRALAAVGATLLRSVRAEDVACRYGGEEFALILTECSLQDAVIRANDIRQSLKECRFQDLESARSKTGGDSIQQYLETTPSASSITVSIGVAAFAETTDRIHLLMKFADTALYQAKRNGRNCVVAATPTSRLPNPDSNSQSTDRTQSASASTI